MVLLRGLNYDFSGQETSYMTTAMVSATTTCLVANTKGFSANDYIVIEPRTEKAEIVKITTVNSQTSLTVGATVLSHAINSPIYRLPYNQIKFYECSTATGTYTLVAASTVALDYSTNYTNFNYPAGDADYFYKRTFYNSTTAVESDIALSDYWQTSDEQMIITPDQLRVYLQFDENDYPNKNDMNTFILLAQDQIALDLSTSSVPVLRIATFMLSKFYVLRGLATKSISKGYVTVNAEGRNITKAFQELVLEAENTLEEYHNFCLANARSEVTYTTFIKDSGCFDETTYHIRDIMTGAQNARDYQSGYSRVRRWR